MSQKTIGLWAIVNWEIDSETQIDVSNRYIKILMQQFNSTKLEHAFTEIRCQRENINENE